MIFRMLTPKDVKEFREYAAENDPPSIEIDTYVLYHPVCRKVWLDRGVAPCAMCARGGQQVTLNQHALGFDHEYEVVVTIDMAFFDSEDTLALDIEGA